MVDVWPLTLPQKPLSGTLVEQRQDNVLRGPAARGAKGQSRRLFSATSKTISFSMHLTTAQLATLETFYNDTLGDGVYSFTFNDPSTGVDKVFSFVEPFQPQHVARDFYRVSFTLIRDPE